MKKATVLVALILLAGTTLVTSQERQSGTAQEAKAGTQQALAAVRAQSEAFVDAFNKGDAKAIAALWTEDCEYIDDTGRAFSGRGEVEQGYTEFFANNPGSKITVTIDSLRQLGGNTVIEDGHAVVDPAPEGSPGASYYTAVHVNVDGKWLMASVRDTWVETPSAHQAIADLEWLIGSWTAEGYGATIESTCRWVANKSFVERTYSLTYPDGTQESGLQLIGWNPQDGHVQSWDFSPDGGHAVGIWYAQESGWAAEMKGVAGDGTTTMSVNVMTKLDDNAYSWQSVERTIGNQPVPDTSEVIVKRLAAAK